MHGLIFLAFRESDDCLLLAQAPPFLPTYTHPTRGPAFRTRAAGAMSELGGRRRGTPLQLWGLGMRIVATHVCPSLQKGWDAS